MKVLSGILTVLFVVGCSTAVEQDPEQVFWTFHRTARVPGHTLDLAIGHIVDRVGREFFEKHIYHISGFGDQELYLTRWSVDFGSISGAKQIFFVVLTPEGQLKKPIELPNCLNNDCEVTIGKDQAEAIAASTLGLEKYNVIDFDFRYGGPDRDCFIWLVSMRPPKLSREHGKTVIVHAATGQVLDTQTFRRYKPPPN